MRLSNQDDPAHPREVGAYDTPGSARGVALAGSYIYVADEDGGLDVLRLRMVPAN